MPGKPFSGKKKKAQLQAKREKKAHKGIYAAEKESNEQKEWILFPSAAIANELSMDVGYSGDLRTIFAKEHQSVIDARKRDGTRPLEMALDCGNSQSIYQYGIDDISNQPSIPIRPYWSKEMNPSELNELEEESFRQWLTDLHGECIQREKQHEINSYERNLQVWRQLWRVIEKSNVLVHLADSRCPLLHLSDRLIRHIQMDHPTKRLLILLTKSDFVSTERQEEWIGFIQKRYDVPVVSYSRDHALESNAFLLKTIGQLSRETNYTKDGNDDVQDVATLMVGLVGEPNVGKSSFLNNMFMKKLVSVSATPGHTKHFQTHFYDKPELVGRDDIEKVCFCDCPGVVFPRFGVPLALQILFGSYPIAQTREPYSAIRFMAENSSPTLQEIYKLKKVEEDDDWSPYTIAEAYAAQRGFHVKGGKLDVFRAANLLLRDTLNGKKVILSFPPPTTHAMTMSNDKLTLEGLDIQANE